MPRVKIYLIEATRFVLALLLPAEVLAVMIILLWRCWLTRPRMDPMVAADRLARRMSRIALQPDARAATILGDELDA